MKIGINFWQGVTFAITFGSIVFAASAAGNINPFIETFSKLPATDTLQVLFASQGCFGGSAYEFNFRHGSKNTVAVASGWRNLLVENKSFWGTLTDIPNLFFLKKRKQQKDRNLGHVTLTESDLNGLDELLRVYRSIRRDNCTSTDTIEISQIHDGKIIAMEKFIDKSCDLYYLKNVTTFPAIARRLDKNK
jgi:hypothetical protein